MKVIPMSHPTLLRSVFLALVFLALFPAAVAAQSKKQIKQASQLIDQAKKAFAQKDYRSAADLFGQATAITPKNADAHFRKGYAHYYLKENDKALDELNTALSLGANAQDIYKLRWYLYKEKKDYAAALVDINAALKIEPANELLLRGLGDINFDRGAFRDALTAYETVLKSNPNDANLYFNIAKIQSGLGNTQEQAKAAETAIAKGTIYLADAYMLLGDAYRKDRRYAEAASAYQRAINSKPELYAAYRILAEVYRADNKYEEAIEVSKRALRQFPLDGQIYTDISWFYSLAGRNEEAVQAAQAGVKILPDRYLAYTNLCRAYNDVNKPELAVSQCNAALRLNPEDGETYFYLARANDLIGKTNEATRYYGKAVIGLEKVTRDNPDNSDGFYLLGNAYFADNQREKAIEAYRTCLRLNPNFVKARYNMGIIQVLQKNKSAALEQYNSLLSLDQTLAGKLKVEIDKL